MSTEPSNDTGAPVVLRAPRPGDLSWVVYRQAVLYQKEYGWGERFEALVLQVAADFLRAEHPDRQAGWIAERDGEVLGAVFLTQADEHTGKLRMLYVEESARGLGLGRRLVRACIAGARERGYQSLMLWTNAVLGAARGIYEAEGFTLVHSEVHEQFGVAEVGETWTLSLS